MYYLYILVLFFVFVALYVVYILISREQKNKSLEKEIKKIMQEADLQSPKEFDENFYGVSEDPSIIKQHIREIVDGIKKRKSFYLNVVEAYYLLEHFGERIVKSESGKYYLIDKKTVQEFLHSFDSNHIKDFLRELKKIESKLVQKEHEKIVVKADELFYRIRMGQIDGSKSERFIGFSSYEFAKDAEFVIVDEQTIEELKKKQERQKDRVVEIDVFKKDGDKEFIELNNGSKVFLTNDGVVVEESAQEKKDTNPIVEAAREMKEAVNQMQRLMLQSSDEKYGVSKDKHSETTSIEAEPHDGSEDALLAKTPVSPPNPSLDDTELIDIERIVRKKFQSFQDIYKCAAKKSCSTELIQRIVAFSSLHKFPLLFMYGNGVVYVSTIAVVASIVDMIDGDEKEEIFSKTTEVFDAKRAANLLRKLQDESKKHSKGLFYPDDLKPIQACVYLGEKCYFAKYLVINRTVVSALPHSLRKMIEDTAVNPKKVVFNSGSCNECMKIQIKEIFLGS